MRTKHYIVLGIALVLVVVLAMLPKAVLVKEGPAGRGKVDSTAEAPVEEKKSEQSHSRTLTEVQKTKVEQWKATWSDLQAKNLKENQAKFKQMVDSLAMTFVEVGLYDSAAFYRNHLALRLPTALHQQEAGDVSFDAYTLALDDAKRKKYIRAAREWYELALKTDPSNLDSKAKLALTYVDSDNPMQGILMLREVVKANPEHELATYNLGVFAIQTKQWDKAVGRFEQLTKINPKSTKAYYYLGVCLKELGEKAKAIAALRQARLLDKDPAVIASIDEVLGELEANNP